MYRFLLMALLFVGVAAGRPVLAQSASGLPARPVPFTFVTDQGSLLSAGDVKKLDSGLRAYAEKTGTQVVVVTVPNLGGRSAADYARALGTAWGVGQRDKNNGVVVLLSAQDHKISIQPGSGLASVITPAVTSRVIGEMTPAFKQGNYFAGLKTGLNRLLVTANPSSAPGKETTSAPAAAATSPAASSGLSDNSSATTTPAATLTEPAGAIQSETAPAPSGIGMGTLLLGAVVIGGILFFIIRMFRSKSVASNNGGTPNFYPTSNANAQPNQPTFYPNQNGPMPGNYPNQGGNNSGTGSGMGGILATGAAAAAGAYLGNRLGGSHDSGSSAPQQFGNNNSNSGLGTGAAAAGTGAAGDYFAGRGGSASSNDDSAPDYFSGNESSNSGDYFSSDNSSYDDTSSGDTGGGGFDSTDDNSGSW